jgi:two-component system, cell cycle sensor histidine kinase and response regulator CckA
MSALPRSEFDLLDRFPFPAWHCDPDGQCDYLNRQWLGFTGQTLEQQALGDGWAASVHPDDLEAAMGAYREAVQARRPFALEYRLRRHDGEYRWVVAHGSVWEDAGGQFSGYLGACYDVTERKRAEEKARFRDLLLNQVRNAVIAFDLEGRVVYWNRHAETLYQWKTEEVVGKNIIELLAPGDEDLLAQRILSTLLVHGYWEGEFEVRRKDGSILPTHAIDVLLKDGGGHTLGFVGVSVDITEQRRTEAQLRRQRAMLSSAVRIAGLGCWDYDLLQDRLEWADETLGIFGTTREAFGATMNAFLAFVHPDDREALQAMGAKSLMDRGTVDMEYRIVRPDGEVRIVYDRGEVVFDGRGEPIRRTGVVMDITERKRAEKELLESEARFRQLAEAIHDVFWLADAELRSIIYVSPAYEMVWGRPCKDLYASPNSWLEAVHPYDRPQVLEALEARAKTDLPYELEHRILRPDGAVRWISNRAFPVRDAAGHLIRIAGVAEDVTERRQLEMQLRQAQKMEAIGQLAGGVAHDFNNLLAVVFGHSELLASASPSPERLRDSLAEISRAAERAAALTRQLLTFSRRQVVEPRLLDLQVVVTESHNLLQHLIGEDVRLALILSPRLSAVRADPGQIDQVLMNLALNARDAMAQGGLLTIETGEVNLDAAYAKTHPQVRPGRHVLLTVTDTGRGMTPEVQARIFEPFFTTKRDGTGMGLSVVHGIVRQNGGHVCVESRLGCGTTFKIYLPALADPVVNAPASALPAPLKGGGETVLLVEDEASVRKVTALLLNTLGYRVLEASCAEDAVRRFQESQEKIDLLMTDLVMPDMNGWELANRLWAGDPTLKALFQSGYTDDAVMRHGILHAEVAFLKKPFTLNALARKVRDVLDQS